MVRFTAILFLSIFTALCAMAEDDPTFSALIAPYRLSFDDGHLGKAAFMGQAFSGYTPEEQAALKKLLASTPTYEEYRAKLFSETKALAVFDVLDPGEDTGAVSLWHFPTAVPLFVDLGPGGSAKRTMETLVAQGFRKDTRVNFLLTHPHFDHYGIFEVFYSLLDVGPLAYFHYPYNDTYRWVYFMRAALAERGALDQTALAFFQRYEAMLAKMQELSDKDPNAAMALYYAFIKQPEFLRGRDDLHKLFFAKAIHKVELNADLPTGTPGVRFRVIYFNGETDNTNNSSIAQYVTVDTPTGTLRGLLLGDGEGADTAGKKWTSNDLAYSYTQSAEYQVLRWLVEHLPDLFEGPAHGLDFLEAPHHGSRNGAFNVFFHKTFTPDSDYRRILDMILSDLATSWARTGKTAKEIETLVERRKELDLRNLIKTDRRTVTWCTTGDTNYGGTQHPYHSTVENYAPSSRFHLLERYPEPFNLSRTEKQMSEFVSLANQKNVTSEQLLTKLLALRNEDPQGKPQAGALFDPASTYEKQRLEKYVADFLAGRLPKDQAKFAADVEGVIAFLLGESGTTKDAEALALVIMKQYQNTYFPYGSWRYALRLAEQFLEAGCTSLELCNERLTAKVTSLLREVNYNNALTALISRIRGLVVGKCRSQEQRDDHGLRMLFLPDGTIATRGGVPLR